MRVTLAEIDRSALRNNFRQVQQRAFPAKIMAIVKANSYGHGIEECSEIFAHEGAAMLGVAFADEAVPIRERGIEIPVVVLTPPLPEEAELFTSLNLEFVTGSVQTVQAFSQAARQGRALKAHLYIDTGLRRDGIEPQDAIAFMEACKKFSNIAFTGICTHFATSDEADQAFTLKQLTLFNETLRTLAEAGYTFEHIHAANSGAIAQQPQARFTIARPGLTLYGYNPSNELSLPFQLQPVMTLKTRIHTVRTVPPETSVSYGRTYFTKQETVIATIPIGYADGLMRILSGRAQCLIRGKRYPIVGRICMDQCMIDLGTCSPIQAGEEVVLIGRQGNAMISAQEVAAEAGTISYEILSAVSARVPRVYVQ